MEGVACGFLGLEPGLEGAVMPDVEGDEGVEVGAWCGLKAVEVGKGGVDGIGEGGEGLFGDGIGVVLGVALVEVADVVGGIGAAVDHFAVWEAFGEFTVCG